MSVEDELQQLLDTGIFDHDGDEKSIIVGAIEALNVRAAIIKAQDRKLKAALSIIELAKRFFGVHIRSAWREDMQHALDEWKDAKHE
jgi:hypothetical protein